MTGEPFCCQEHFKLCERSLYFRKVQFAPEQIAYLREHPVFRAVPSSWFERLKQLRFDGDLWAVPEGTIVFAGEPLLRVTAPLMVAQVVETYLVTTMTMQTLIASKAARVVTAAQGRSVFDFGSRRAHGPQAGLLAARAAYLVGCVGTSNTEAGRLLGIPAMGTQAHSWVMAWGDELDAFRKFGEVFPHSATMLIDTFDTIQGARNALASGAPMQAVRLDSGDLSALSKEVRTILDAHGRPDVKIVASGDLNEYKVRDLLSSAAPIDVFGVGTELVTSRDDPRSTPSTSWSSKKHLGAAWADSRCRRGKGPILTASKCSGAAMAMGSSTTTSSRGPMKRRLGNPCSGKCCRRDSSSVPYRASKKHARISSASASGCRSSSSRWSMARHTPSHTAR